ncbi:MAG: hypothetical protein ACKOWF_20075 [Chloroflexota bacterium]
MAQAADVFAVMYDWLNAHVAAGAPLPELPPHADLPGEMLVGLVADLGAYPADLHPGTLRAIESFVDPGVDDADLRVRVLRVLRAIDHAARVHMPSSPSFGDGLGAVLVTTGRYNRDTSGYLLPRHPLDAATADPPALSRCFFHLVRADVHRTAVPLVPCRGRSVDRPRVAVAPVLYTHAWPGNPPPHDAAFTQDDLPDDRSCYRLKHDSQGIARRIPRIIHEVYESGADVALLPELSLDGGLFEVLRDELRRQDLRQPVPRAFLLVVGVADGCRNRAMVLDNAGNILGETAKHLPWDLEIQSQERYDLLDCFGHPPDMRRECLCDNDGPRPIYAAAANRWTVSICQDFDRASPLSGPARELAELRCGLIIHLVLDGLLHKDRWCVRSASELAEMNGADVVIANSLMLANTPSQRDHRARKAGLPDTYPHGDLPAGVIVGPGGRLTWLDADMAGSRSLLSRCEPVRGSSAAPDP